MIWSQTDETRGGKKFFFRQLLSKNLCYFFFFLEEKLKQNLSQEVFTFWEILAVFVEPPALILTLRQARHCRIITV